VVQNNIPFWDILKEDLSGMWSSVPETDRIHQEVQGVPAKAPASARGSRAETSWGGSHSRQATVVHFKMWVRRAEGRFCRTPRVRSRVREKLFLLSSERV